MAKYKGVFERDDGRWAACPTIDGKRRWFYGRTEEEVQEQVDEARYLAKRGRIVLGTRQTVEQFLEEWLAGMKPPRIRERSYIMYGGHIRRALPTIGAIRLTKLTSRHLQLFYADLGETHAPATIRAMHAVLHQALEQAVRWDLLVRNPADGVQLPKREQAERLTLTRDQVRVLLEGTSGTRWHAFLALMCSTGLRIAEEAGLLWTDLDEANQTLSVHQQVLRRTGAGLCYGPVKSRSSYRTIPLPTGVLQALKKHRAIQAEERLKKGPEWEDHGLIFPTLAGKPNDPRWIRDSFNRILEELELPRITPHQLRHTAATLLLEENKHPLGVKNLLGHSSVAITLDVYSHVTPRVQRELADTMDQLLFGS